MNVTYILSSEKVSRATFQRAWFARLKDFGYLSLTGSQVSEQIDNIINNKKPLSVIGCFMVDDIELNND